jgi:hypothetical protein
MTGKEHLAARIGTHLFLRIDVLELHQHILVVLKPVFLYIERHQDAVDVENEIIGIHTVEHIVGNGKGDFSLHAVGLSQLAYLINVVSSYHIA